MIQRDVLALECVFWESGLKGLGANNWRWKKALGAALALIMSSAAAWKANAPRGNEKSLVETKKQSQESEEKGGAGAEAALKSNWAINYGAQPTKHARVRLPLALFLYTAIGIVSWNSLSHKGNKYIKRYPPPSGDARARSIRSSQVSRRRRRRLQVGLPDIAKSSWKWPPDKKKTESISGRGRTREHTHTHSLRVSDMLRLCSQHFPADWPNTPHTQTTIRCTLFLPHFDNQLLFNSVCNILSRISITNWLQSNTTY